jgi:hypothetical protein
VADVIDFEAARAGMPVTAAVRRRETAATCAADACENFDIEKEEKKTGKLILSSRFIVSIACENVL